MAAHRMAADAALCQNRKTGLDQRRQFVHHIVVHSIMLRPWHLRGVKVETGAMAEIPAAIRVARYVGATRAGVGCNDDHAQFGRHALGARLLHEVFIGATEAGQPVEHRQFFTLLDLRRQIDGEHHVAVEAAGAMAVALVPAAEALVA